MNAHIDHWYLTGWIGCMVGILVLVILIPAVAKERASVGFIFTHFNVDDATGIQDKAYTLAVGLLMSQYSVIG